MLHVAETNFAWATALEAGAIVRFPQVPPSSRRKLQNYTYQMLSVRAGRAGKVFSYTHAMKSDLSSSSDVGMSGSANHHVAGRPSVLDNVEATT